MDSLNVTKKKHCINGVRIRNYSGPYFPAFGLNTERYSVSLRIQYKVRENTEQNNSEYGCFFRSATMKLVCEIRQWL